MLTPTGICDASANDASYIQSALECAKSKCTAEGWALELGLLAPLQLYCAAVGNAVPESIIDSAFACATATTAAPPMTTRQVEHSTTTHRGDSELRETTRSIYTQTTKDEEGHTVELVVPIIIGPNTMFTGKIVTNTMVNNPMTTVTSSVASTTQVPGPTSAEPTQAQGVSSSTAAAQATQADPASGNGSPFENMQAGASQFGFSGAVIGLGLLAGAILRL
jgi:hypothetical protein